MQFYESSSVFSWVKEQPYHSLYVLQYAQTIFTFPGVVLQ
jgi:hypothetical protein